ncbi:MAG: murein biosynthesis integral membrane protein MurJ [Elusimicrobia bacterium GWB2_63_22]|nr:MAG: murein biosynthesis integral membrane protein MurJ [Elusimicrobia bacterium GWB2_63_22]
MTTNLKIAKAASILVAASILGHALSLAKEMLIANYFGVSESMDSFYAAMTVPNLLNNVFLSLFAILFIPVIARYRTKDLAETNRIISTVSNLILIVLAALVALIFLFAGPIIRLSSPGLAPETAAKAAAMLRIIGAAVLFTGAVNILSSVYNAFERFLWPAVSGIFVTLSTIFFMLLFTEQLGVFALAWGLLAGTILQFVFLAPFARSYGARYSGVLDLEHPEIRKSFGLMFLFLVIPVLSGFNTVVNRFMASWLPAGSITALAYADKLIQVPLMIFSATIASSIYPFLSAQAAENRLEEMKDTVSLSIRMSGFIFIPLTVTMMILAKPAIQLLFQRGAFDAAATELTSRVFVFYCLLLFSNYAAVILMRILFAFQDLKSIIKVVAATLFANIAMNLAFMKLMSPPAGGIALAAALGSLLSAVLFFIVLKKRISNLHGVAIVRSLLRITAFSAVSGLAVFLAHAALAPAPGGTPLGQGAALAASALAGLLCFTAISAFFRLEELSKVANLALNRFRPGRQKPA